MRPNHSDSRLAVPVIDLFAGPGGLGEGFGAFQVREHSKFDVRLSIEKDPIACATLKLRKFFRSFAEAPEELLAYFAGQMPLQEAFDAHAEEAVAARAGVWTAELGKIRHSSVRRVVKDRLKGSEDWVLLGGPPCQAYSIAGRSRMRSTRPNFEADERHLLYREYLQIVADHEPAVFVLENVKGLLTSKHGGEKIVTRILDDLSAPAKALHLSRRSRGYRLYALGRRQAALPWIEEDPKDGEEFLLKAEEYGIPQMRHRIFIVGVRTDVEGRPAALDFQPQISTGDVLSDLPALRSQLSREEDSLHHWRSALHAILEYPWMSVSGSAELRPVVREVRRITTKLSGVSFNTGAAYVAHEKHPAALGKWYRNNTVGLTHHEARAHMRTDLHRYMFAAAYAKVHGRSPEVQHFPQELRPAHRNISMAIHGDMFNDRFRVQVDNRPSTTITSHISKDGHYYIHYDPLQCRSLTVREAARLQTFPDNYFFEGTRTQQYHQIGNAVPPLLAMDIARVVYDLLSAAGRVHSFAAPPARGKVRIAAADLPTAING